MGVCRRLAICLVSLMLLFGCVLYSGCDWFTPEPPLPQPNQPDEFEGMRNKEGLVPTFRDEFNGNSLDKTKWQHEVRGNWYNNELQYYDEEATTVSFGSLKITAVKNTKTFDKNGVETADPEKIDFSRHYGSSRIRSFERFSQKYGRFEARMRLPAQQAMWPAFWMLSEKGTYGAWPYSGEIDIMESKGRFSDYIGRAIHFRGRTGSTYVNNRFYFQDGGSIEDFHTYAVEWEYDTMRWYIDDVLSFSVEADDWAHTSVKTEENPTAPFDQEFHMLLNLAVGGNYDKDDNDDNVRPLDDFVSATMEVDWVRVWQFEKYLT